MILYDIFFFMFALAYLPYLVIKGKAHRDFMQRFGKLPAAVRETGASRPLWIHAVSVGEVVVAKNFINGLSARFPAKKIVLSTTTRTGNTVAKAIFGDRIPRFYFPADFSFVVRRVANIINPAAVFIMETEIWPNLILELSRKDIPIALINGRISNRSFKGYRKIKFLFGNILKRINLFCMQTEMDAENIKALGAPEDRVKVTGNMKFDTEELIPSAGWNWGSARQAELVGNSRLLVAGSTHGGEEEMILEVYGKLVRKFRDLRLLIAPRHVDRSDAIKKLAARMGFEGILVSNFKKETRKSISEKTVLILDTLGELKSLFGQAGVVFMGGSLVKRGGHNIVEPALFGKPIIFGPYMFNFRGMAKLFLEGKAALQVKDKAELLQSLETLLGDSEKRNVLGRNAKNLLDKNRGATGKNIEELARFAGGHKW